MLPLYETQCNLACLQICDYKVPTGRKEGKLVLETRLPSYSYICIGPIAMTEGAFSMVEYQHFIFSNNLKSNKNKTEQPQLLNCLLAYLLCATNLLSLMVFKKRNDSLYIIANVHDALEKRRDYHTCRYDDKVLSSHFLMEADGEDSFKVTILNWPFALSILEGEQKSIILRIECLDLS